MRDKAERDYQRDFLLEQMALLGARSLIVRPVAKPLLPRRAVRWHDGKTWDMSQI